MKITDIQLSKCFPSFDATLIKEIKEHAQIKHFNSQEYILKQGSYPKSLPIILKGLIKLYLEENGKKIFLHYLNPYRSLLTYIHLSHQKPMDYSVKTCQFINI